VSKLPARILFLFSDTGGGHRSAAQAIIEALNQKFGDQIVSKMVDIFKEYAPPPLNRAPDWYPWMVRIPQIWGISYHISDGYLRARLVNKGYWFYIRKAIKSLFTQHPCDLIVSVHPLAIAPTIHTLGENRPRFVTVVTDLVSTHALWFHPQVDLCIVPTQEAKQRALIFNMKPEQVRVVGLPVAESFCINHGDKTSLRRRLGLPLDFPVVLLVGGAQGMGPIESVARTIATSSLPITLVIITGRNIGLRKRLQSQEWQYPTLVYGFVEQMAEFMQAADILLTKAGPGTICEALNCGLPMIIYSHLPGQEDGNISYVVQKGAGIWAPQPEMIVNALRGWLDNPDEYAKAVQACRRIARPEAAGQIADLLAKFINLDST